MTHQMRRWAVSTHGEDSKLCTSRQAYRPNVATFPVSSRQLPACNCPARLATVCGSSPNRSATGAPQRNNSDRRQAAAGVDETKEAHKVFDEVYIHVKSGNGGRGEIVEAGRGKWVTNFKYKPGGNQSKKIWLPASTPADGADGADVILRCDPEVDNLLHLHKRSDYAARNGSNANPAVGSAGPKKNKDIRKASTPPLVISVPPGTVVKRKSTGAFLGELLNPGEMLVVARGGKGGSGAKAPTREANLRETNRQYKLANESGAEVVAVEDNEWQIETKGLPGSQMSLHLMLRVVADIGIVGFPNAGKSSLLAALTRASPEVAAYPFTTLMPNLGVMSPDAQSKEAQEEDEFELPGSRAARRKDRMPILADLPGLIEGAHMGKGLGRMFLRHLRRTHALLHVVDAAAADPATDYYAVREELRMYNPEYCAKPHIVALNKMDLEDADSLREEVMTAIRLTAQRHCQEWEGEEIKPTMPVSVVACSAVSGDGLQDLRAAVQRALDVTSKATVSKGGRKGGSPSQQSASESKQQLSAAIATAMGGAAALVAGAEGVADEAAAEVDLPEDERWLLGLSEEELLRLEAESGAGGAAGASGASAVVDEDGGAWADADAEGSGRTWAEGECEEGGEAEGGDREVDEGMEGWDDEEGVVQDKLEDEGEGGEGEEAAQEWEAAEEDAWLLNLSEEELLKMVQD